MCTFDMRIRYCYDSYSSTGGFRACYSNIYNGLSGRLYAVVFHEFYYESYARKCACAVGLNFSVAYVLGRNPTITIMNDGSYSNVFQEWYEITLMDREGNHNIDIFLWGKCFTRCGIGWDMGANHFAFYRWYNKDRKLRNGEGYTNAYRGVDSCGIWRD